MARVRAPGEGPQTAAEERGRRRRRALGAGLLGAGAGTWIGTLVAAAIYADLAKPFAEQSMKITYRPVRLETGPDLYAEWKRRQSGPA